jgi:RNA polymerase sigma factor (sigma-70 family)
MRTTLSIIEPDSQIAQSLQSLGASIGLDVRTYATAGQFLDDYSPERRGCILMSVQLPDADGLSVLSQLVQRHAYQPVTIMLSNSGSVESAVQAMRAGVLDYIEKPFQPAYLLQQIQQAVLADASLYAQYEQHRRLEHAMRQLTFRERQVLSAVLSGKPNKQIAAELDLSFKTVSWHRSTALRKLKLTNIFDLARQDLSRTLTWSCETAQHQSPDPVATHGLTIHVRPMPITRQAI